jgi:hypothetical protein
MKVLSAIAAHNHHEDHQPRQTGVNEGDRRMTKDKPKDGLLGPVFDSGPYERPDGTLDEACIDAFVRHAAMRATARMLRVTEREDNDD